jgi:hypothetical protein
MKSFQNRLLVAASFTLALVLVSSKNAIAAPTSQAQFDALMDEFGVITSYRAVAPAAPLGIIGFDLSLEATSGTYEGNSVILPKIKFQKGLIAGLDVAGYYSAGSIPGESASATAYGAAITYAILKGGVASPAWNVRGSYTSLEIPNVVSTTTTGIDTSISKGFGPVTPYVGVGTFMLNGTDLTGNFFNKYDATKTRYYYGVSLDMLAFNLTFEGDNTDGTNSYSAKIGFRIGD